jgi:hypothetical protein
MREALVRAHEYGMAVSLRGSGYVVAQQPRAGAPVSDVREMRLELRPERVALLQ